MTSKTTPTLAEMVVHVEEYAVAHYEEGWDIWVESLEVEEKEAIVSGAKSKGGALKKAKAHLKPMVEAAAIQAENCGLYDTGEEESTARYEQYQRNAENWGKSVIDPAKKKHYYGKSIDLKSDPVANVLTREITNGNVEFKDVCIENGIDPDRWSHLNFGMQRMNLGNVLRGMIKKGKSVEIGGKPMNG